MPTCWPPPSGSARRRQAQRRPALPRSWQWTGRRTGRESAWWERAGRTAGGTVPPPKILPTLIMPLSGMDCGSGTARRRRPAFLCLAGLWASMPAASARRAYVFWDLGGLPLLGTGRVSPGRVTGGMWRGGFAIRRRFAAPPGSRPGEPGWGADFPDRRRTIAPVLTPRFSRDYPASARVSDAIRD